jgi:hypothetical protein
LVRWSWHAWRWIGNRANDVQTREARLGSFGPAVLILLLVAWVVGLIIGYGLILDAVHEQVNPVPANLGTTIYFSAISFLTIGYGDFVPVGTMARAVALIEGATGLGVVAVVISLLFSLYGSFQRREVLIITLDALAVVKNRGGDVRADVIGTGPLEQQLRQRLAELGLDDSVRFHGFVTDHRDVERLLAEAAIAVAPYRPGEDTFTAYADPGKLKAYLAAGLPILLTDVPPNAKTLARDAGAELVPYDAEAIATAIMNGLSSPEGWRERRAAALAYVTRFDWEALLEDLLEQLQLPVR